MAKPSASFTLFGGRREVNPKPVGIARFFGKSFKAAQTAGKRFLRNVAAGFYDGSGTFHPIRASGDYDPVRTGEAGRPRPYGTKRVIPTARQRKLAKARKRKPARRKKKNLNFGQRMVLARAKKARARRR